MRILAVVASAIGTLLVWTALQPQALYADSTLDSYKRVDGLKGCDSIPYDTLRSRCIDTSVDVQNYCKEKELKRSCKELPKVRDAYDDPKLKDDPHAQKETADGYRKEIELRQGWNEKCRDSRSTIKGIFDDVITQAKNESDPNIKPYAEKAIVYWEKEDADHAQARQDAQNAVQNCADKK